MPGHPDHMTCQYQLRLLGDGQPLILAPSLHPLGPSNSDCVGVVGRGVSLFIDTVAKDEELRVESKIKLAIPLSHCPVLSHFWSFIHRCR